MLCVGCGSRRRRLAINGQGWSDINFSTQLVLLKTDREAFSDALPTLPGVGRSFADISCNLYNCYEPPLFWSRESGGARSSQEAAFLHPRRSNFSWKTPLINELLFRLAWGREEETEYTWNNCLQKHHCRRLYSKDMNELRLCSYCTDVFWVVHWLPDISKENTNSLIKS